MGQYGGNKHKGGGFSQSYHRPSKTVDDIVTIDCGTTRTAAIDLNKIAVKNFFGAFIVTPQGLVRLCEENQHVYDKQVIHVRMSYMCADRIGCKVCFRIIRDPANPPPPRIQPQQAPLVTH